MGFLQTPRECDAIDLSRHDDVAEYNGNTVMLDFADGGFRIADPLYIVAKFFQEAGARGRDIGIVLHQQDCAHAGYEHLLGRDSGTALAARKAERHVRPYAKRALDGDSPACLIDKAMYLRKAEPRALANGIRCEKGIKDLSGTIVRNADAGIRNGDANVIARMITISETTVVGGDGHRATFRHGVSRIENEIDERRLEFRRVRQYRP